MLICNFSGAYKNQDFYDSIDCTWLDMSDIEGTNCYLDDSARSRIERRLCEVGAFEEPDIHFIDSGNYHYMSLMFLNELDRKNEEFNLLVFDNHPDMKPAAFGGITSCGGWILEAAEKYKHLRQICLIGVDEGLMSELKPLPDSAVGKLTEPDRLDKRIPIYISIDKDVMPEPYTYCQWSQGDTDLESLMKTIRKIADTTAILGIDICGESEEIYNEKHQKANNQTNAKLLEFCLDII